MAIIALDDEESFDEEEPEMCPICSGLGEDPVTEKICTSCHGQGWKSKDYKEELETPDEELLRTSDGYGSYQS